MFNNDISQTRGGVAGPAGPALTGPLFSGSLVSFSDCRDSLRLRPLGQVCQANSPLPCASRNRSRSFASGSGARRGPTRLHRHRHIFDSTSNFYCRTTPVVDSPPHTHTPPCGFFFWTRFENLVAKRRKINDRVIPILVAVRNWNDVIACQDPRKSLSLPSVLLLAV